jgi:hypothetical protein
MHFPRRSEYRPTKATDIVSIDVPKVNWAI